MITNTKLSVSEFSFYVSKIFENETLLHNIDIIGEVSSFSITNNIAYFQIKDANATLSCILFDAKRHYSPQIGEKIIVTGSPSYYIKGGRFSFNCTDLKQFGIGELYKQFEEMKKKLSDEGLFDITHKKEKPDHIKKIGVVTSKQGAVIHDIINVCSRRDMSVSIILYPVKVQGIGAEIEIARGIEFFNKYNVDAVVVARGGGSLEDLSPFNTEIVARATYNSNKYIVSAVGHETDYTIIDYVSDLRAPTPSAAAELLTIDRSELIENFYNNIFCLKNAYTQLIDFKKQDLGINNAKINNNISFLLNKERDLKISNLTLIDSLYTAKINQESTTVDGTIQLLKTSDPSSILKRGYAKIEKDEKSITSKKQLGYGENIDIIFSDGTISATTYNKGENQ